jgi:hypothetical protein
MGVRGRRSITGELFRNKPCVCLGCMDGCNVRNVYPEGERDLTFVLRRKHESRKTRKSIGACLSPSLLLQLTEPHTTELTIHRNPSL